MCRGRGKRDRSTWPAEVIAAASSDDKLEMCKKLGADYVVNYSKQKLKDAVGEITKGEFCDVIYDPVGGEIFDQCVRCVTPKGYARLLVVGFASGTIPKFGINMALIKGFDLVGVRSGAQLGLGPRGANLGESRSLQLGSSKQKRAIPPPWPRHILCH
ncbi:Quinone oxidoreductase-like protein 2-like [Symbiodinium microadriaticum]|uniref:Quinone oxidoreductase-like protein 2-like n=1 Tax=Symbiodinium microadriaticum TaxID=2951 RepID=A0A1Q9C9I2_SYMMI|nr:Quinone oxidoreductase-like protein 2-like [Symbiodinium microadriaticum]